MKRRLPVRLFVFIALPAAFCFQKLEAQSVTLAWNRSLSPDVRGYVLWYSTSPGSYSNKNHSPFPTTGTNATLTNLHVNTRYYFSVGAFDAKGKYNQQLAEI